MAEENLTAEEMRAKIKTIAFDLKKSNNVQKASGKLLNHTVNDLLTFAQINGGKFRKNLSNFDIQKAIKEIMMIQQEKADFMNIKLTSVFIDFPSADTKYILCTDEERLQSVLLNF